MLGAGAEEPFDGGVGFVGRFGDHHLPGQAGAAGVEGSIVSGDLRVGVHGRLLFQNVFSSVVALAPLNNNPLRFTNEFLCFILKII